MSWLKNDVGFSGWRYDMVVGYPGWVIGIYNDYTTPLFTVGEYFKYDAEEAINSAYAPPFPNGDQMVQGYAFILTNPGTPCIFWKDIFDSGSGYENEIRELISIRYKYGINSESHVWIDKEGKDDCYAAYIYGDKGEIAMKMGPGSWFPTGAKWDPINDLLTSGNDYAVWGEVGKWLE